jgi:hypothetical protein
MRCKRAPLLAHLKVLLNIVTRVTQSGHPPKAVNSAQPEFSSTNLSVQRPLPTPASADRRPVMRVCFAEAVRARGRHARWLNIAESSRLRSLRRAWLAPTLCSITGACFYRSVECRSGPSSFIATTSTARLPFDRRRFITCRASRRKTAG